MKTCSIGDIHGRNSWKSFIKNKTIDKYIFVGDYTDSYDKTNEQIISNLLEIIQFKKDNEDRVILLLGNHDIQYYNHPDFIEQYRCSGYRPESHWDLYEVFRENYHLFQYAYQYQNYIWTHAGIQHDWFVNKFRGDIGNQLLSIADQLNYPTSGEQEFALQHVGYMRGGRNDCGGPLWCDFNELKKPLKNFIQIVGHTHRHLIFKYENKNYGAEVYFIDVLEEDIDDKCLYLEI